MNSFYISGAGAPGEIVRLLPEEARHACQVLRLRAGEAICAVDEAGRRFEAEIAEISRDACAARLIAELPSNEPELRVTLYQGLPKSDKLDLIVQKLTELGAARVVPVKMDRCVVKFDARDGEKRRARLEKIAREAAKQCRRARAPQIEAPRSWREIEEDLRAHELLLVPWEDEHALGLKQARDQNERVRDLGVVIGPEGGMGGDEVEYLRKLGAQTVTLGPRILRTETAAVAACALSMLLWGDVG